ncbi:MAG: glyoxylase-like metal-dependent hydrolase (beta-lactamase superfamily II), partial [Porticoccaceae bacterium]
MRVMTPLLTVAITCFLFLSNRCSAEIEQLLPSLQFERGPVNGVLFGTGDIRAAIYSKPASSSFRPHQIFLTHHRRDVVTAAFDGVLGHDRLRPNRVRIYAPGSERELFEQPHEFWESFWTKRFHDYAQQSTKILTAPEKIDRYLSGNTRIVSTKNYTSGVKTWRLRTLETPGFTRGAMSYIVDIDGKRVAFTGDLIYGDGQLFDLYSFQDVIPEAKIGGYHGHASRLAMLIPSLKKIAAEKPDMIVPARGPVIRNPQEAIAKLIGRVEAYYRNYLSTNALNWYFKEERMTVSGRRVLGEDAEV